MCALTAVPEPASPTLLQIALDHSEGEGGGGQVPVNVGPGPN